MDRPGVQQVPEGCGEHGKMEKTGCKIICGAPTTLAVKGLMMMMMTVSYSCTLCFVWFVLCLIPVHCVLCGVYCVLFLYTVLCGVYCTDQLRMQYGVDTLQFALFLHAVFCVVCTVSCSFTHCFV